MINSGVDVKAVEEEVTLFTVFYKYFTTVKNNQNDYSFHADFKDKLCETSVIIIMQKSAKGVTYVKLYHISLDACT